MRKSILISKILFFITRLLAYLYLITGLYGAFSYSTNTNLIINKAHTIVTYPFTQKSFLILDSSTNYLIFSFLIPVFAYCLFFWLLSNVFKVFHQQKLFTSPNILHLQRFYLANIVLPIILTAFSSLFVPIESELFVIVMLHIFLGVFVFFMSEIFSQGVALQNEQDLYI